MFSSIHPAQGRPSLRRLAGAAAVASACIWLAGCAGVRTIDSDVQSYSTLQQVPAPPTYRLQLLPSQIALGPQFDTVIQQAEASLAGVGLRRDDRQGSVIAQIDAQARYIPDSWLMPGSPYNPYGGLGWGPGWGWGWRGGIAWRDTGPSLHYRAVQLTLRDVQTQQVVYETSARYEDVWVDDQVIYRILFDSALNGFPQPPQGPRRVTTTTGGKPASTQPAPASVSPAAAVNPAAPSVKSK